MSRPEKQGPKIKVVRSPSGLFVIRWLDETSGKWRQKSANTRSREDAVRQAGELIGQLKSKEWRPPPVRKLPWDSFCEVYQRQHLSGRSPKTAANFQTAQRHFQKICRPASIAGVSTAMLAEFVARLREDGRPETTIATYLRPLLAALRWAEQNGYIQRAPAIKLPKRAASDKRMRGRPVTNHEFKKILKAAGQIRPSDAKHWVRLLRGLWLSGLRIEEAASLSWDASAAFSVDMSGKFPKFRIHAEGEKGFEDRLLPLTPDFAAMLAKTPKDHRAGLVLGVPSRGGRFMDADRLKKVIAQIGRKAKVVVSHDRGRRKKDGKSQPKYATAHDLRRSFGTRWASRVRPAQLQKLMRHRSIATTMTYYVEIEADEMAADLWREWGGDQKSDK